MAKKRAPQRRVAIASRLSGATMDSRPTRTLGVTEFEWTVPALAPSRWPSISACLIVKNEARNLPDCLRSLGDLPSEIIVVDTGSTDGTQEIATSQGASVYHFPWIEDFAAARNASLSHATMDWVFWLDADDRLSPQDIAQLKVAAASQHAEAYMCLVRSDHDGGGWNSTEHIRLFKNGLGIAFAGEIHETPAASLARIGARLARTDIMVHHVGYHSPDAVKEKTIRNLRLLERQRGLHPEDPALLFYLGQAYTALGETDKAAASLSQYLKTTGGADRLDQSHYWAYAILAEVAAQRGDWLQVQQLLPKALSAFPRHPQFLFYLARVQIATGRHADALQNLSNVYERLDRPMAGSMPSQAWVEASLSECACALGRLEESLKWAELAWAHAPGWDQSAIALSRLYVQAGRLQDAEDVLNQVAGTSNRQETWLGLADIHFRRRQWDTAAAAVLEARTRGMPEEQAQSLLSRIQSQQQQSGAPDQTERPHGERNRSE